MATTSKHMLVSVNLASMLGSKVVKEGLGVEGKDLCIGADILAGAGCRFS